MQPGEVVNIRNEGYGIKTIDSKKYPLPTIKELKKDINTNGILFIHPARFLIVCKKMEIVYDILNYMIKKEQNEKFTQSFTVFHSTLC